MHDEAALAYYDKTGFWPPPERAVVGMRNSDPPRPEDVDRVRARLAERKAEFGTLEAKEAALAQQGAMTS